MSDQERIANLETQVKELSRVVAQVLYHVTVRGNMPFSTNDELVRTIDQIITSFRPEPVDGITDFYQEPKP